MDARGFQEFTEGYAEVARTVDLEKWRDRLAFQILKRKTEMGKTSRCVAPRSKAWEEGVHVIGLQARGTAGSELAALRSYIVYPTKSNVYK